MQLTLPDFASLDEEAGRQESGSAVQDCPGQDGVMLAPRSKWPFGSFRLSAPAFRSGTTRSNIEGDEVSNNAFDLHNRGQACKFIHDWSQVVKAERCLVCGSKHHKVKDCPRRQLDLRGRPVVVV